MWMMFFYFNRFSELERLEVVGDSWSSVPKKGV